VHLALSPANGFGPDPPAQYREHARFCASITNRRTLDARVGSTPRLVNADVERNVPAKQFYSTGSFFGATHEAALGTFEHAIYGFFIQRAHLRRNRQLRFVCRRFLNGGCSWRWGSRVAGTTR
jgi:hypothetical protein